MSACGEVERVHQWGTPWLKRRGKTRTYATKDRLWPMNGLIISGYGRAEGRQTRFIAWISTRGKVPSAPPCLACHRPADDEEFFTSDPVRVFLFPSHLYVSFRSPRVHSIQVKNKNPISLTARRLLLHRPHDTASAGSTKVSCTPIFSSPQCNYLSHIQE